MGKKYINRIPRIIMATLAGTAVDTIDGNSNIGFGGGNDEPARAREYDVTEGSVWADDMWVREGWTE